VARARSPREAGAWPCSGSARICDRPHRIDAGMRPMTDDADAPTSAPDPDDHVARLHAEIDAVKARRAGYREEAAETVARGVPRARPTRSWGSSRPTTRSARSPPTRARGSGAE
jgi:hypothetical protein